MTNRDATLENYLVRPVTELPGYMQAKFLVPEDTEIVPGEIFVTEELNVGLGNGNWDVFDTDLMTEENQIPAIIINGGFEKLSDGRRPEGQPDYTQYKYTAGDVASAIKLLPETKFEITPDGLSNFSDFLAALNADESSIAGTWLYPTVNQSNLTWTNDFSVITTKVYLIVEAVKDFRIGGMFGNDFAKTLVVRTKHDGASGNAEQGITAIDAEVTPNLAANDASTEPGATVLTMTAIGGTSDITYELVDNAAGVDNASFAISNNTVVVGADALTEAKTYQIYVEASDGNGDVYGEGFDIPVG